MSLASVGRVLVVLVAAVVALVPGSTAAASKGADIAVTLAVVDGDSEPQRLLATVSNQGPDASEDPLLSVQAEDQAVTGHTGDPQPGSLEDGVACADRDDGTGFSCQWEQLAPGATVEIEITVEVDAAVTVTAVLDPAGTPDPNPDGNNSASVDLSPATADLAVAAAVDEASRTATVTVTVTHAGGREDGGVLAVTPAPADLPAGCAGEGGEGARCELTALTDGEALAFDFLVERPEPEDEPALLTAAVAPATFRDPQPANDRVEIEVAPRAAVPGEVVRLAGAERIATAVAVSRALYPDGGAGAVVLARADLFADALAGAPLAAALDAPVLLTAGTALVDATAEEINRLLGGSGTVVLLGGVAALDEPVEEALSDAGYQPRRVAGPNRYATSAAVDRALGEPAIVAYADGDTFADALIAGSAMASRGGSVLLTAGDRLPEETADRAGDATYAVGTDASLAVPEALHALAGATPAETSVVAAATLFTDPSSVALASADAFPDALAGGPYTAAAGGPMLLSPSDALDPAVAQYLEDTTSVRAVTLFGGTVALSQAVEDAVAAALVR